MRLRLPLGDRLRRAFSAEAESRFHLALDAPRRVRKRSGEHQPGLFGFAVTRGLPDQLHPPHAVARRIRLAQVRTGGAVPGPPFDLLDLTEEQESARSEAPHRLPDLAGVGGRPERKDEDRLLRRPRDELRRRHRQHVALDGEVLATGMHLGPVGECVHRLEADTEAADLGYARILRALPDAADAPDVGLVERKAEVTDPEFGRAEIEVDRAWSRPARPARQRVLRVLEQFVNEVGAVAIAVRQQPVPVLPHAGPVAVFVFTADRQVVAGHQGRRPHQPERVMRPQG